MKRYFTKQGAGMLLALVGLLFIGCAALQCRFKDQVTTSFATGTANLLQCSNKAAIKKWYDDKAAQFGICTAQTGAIADALCKPFIDSIVPGIVDAPIPKEWGCTAENAKESLSALLVDLCKKIPVND